MLGWFSGAFESYNIFLFGLVVAAWSRPRSFSKLTTPFGFFVCAFAVLRFPSSSSCLVYALRRACTPLAKTRLFSKTVLGIVNLMTHPFAEVIGFHSGWGSSYVSRFPLNGILFCRTRWFLQHLGLQSLSAPFHLMTFCFQESWVFTALGARIVK